MRVTTKIRMNFLMTTPTKSLEPDIFVERGLTNEESLEVSEWLKKHKARPEYRDELIEAKAILEGIGWTFPSCNLEASPPTMGPAIPPSTPPTQQHS